MFSTTKFDILLPDRKKANQFCGQEGSIAVHIAGDNEEPLIVVECNPHIKISISANLYGQSGRLEGSKQASF